MVGDSDRFKVGLHGQGFLPQAQELAASFADALRPGGWIGSHDRLQCADGHAVLGPVAGQVRVGRQEVGHDLLPGGFVPFAGVGCQDFDVRIVGEHFSHAFHAGHVRRVPREAFDLHDFTRAAQLLSQPLGGGLRPFLLIDANVIHAGDIQLLVDRDDDDALVQRFLQGGVQTAHIAGIDQDGIHVLGDQVLQLLDLACHICVSAFDHQLIGDAGVHVLLVDFLQLRDHLRAVFAADERVGYAHREFLSDGGCGSAFLDKELLYFFVGHDVIEQEGIRLAFAHRQAFIQVLGSDYGRQRHDKGQSVDAAQLGGIDLFALQHGIGDAQSGRGDAGVVGDSDRFKVGLHGQGFLPQAQELAASFADALRPGGWIGSHDRLQCADGHAVLGPVAGQVRVGRQEVGHDLLPGGFVPFAGVGCQDFDVRIVGEHFSHAFHAGHVRRVPREAFDLHDFTRAAQLLSQPLGGGLRPFLLIDANVIHAGDIQLLVDRDDDDALVQRFLQGGVQTAHIAGIDQDGIHVLGDQVLQLLDLACHICVSAFDHQLIGDAGVHVLLVDFLQLRDHLRAVFAADERVGYADCEFTFIGWLGWRWGFGGYWLFSGGLLCGWCFSRGRRRGGCGAGRKHHRKDGDENHHQQNRFFIHNLLLLLYIFVGTELTRI